MKNALKLLGIAALAAVMGLSLVTCSSSSNGTGDTYSAALFALQEDTGTPPIHDYTSLFGPVPTGMIILPGTKAELTAKVMAGYAISDAKGDVLDYGSGLSYAEVDGAMQNLVTGNYITQNQKNDLMGLLKNQGYGAAAVPVNISGTATTIGIAAAYRE